jgi:hypothetical protein
MKIKVGNVIFPDATIKRFIDIQSGLPLSMINVFYVGKEDEYGELIEAFENNVLVPFECDVLKTKVLVHGFGGDNRTNKRYFILQERAADVSSGYKKVDWTQPTRDKTMAFILPEDIKDLIPPEKLAMLPFIRFILKKDIPKEWFE